MVERKPGWGSGRLRRVVVLWLVGLTLTITIMSAGASHWATSGGDAGRSGYQPVDQGELPVPLHYQKSEASEGNIKTSSIITGGGPSQQLLAYGTANGRIHHQLLGTGAPVGNEDGTSIDDGTPETDTFTGPSVVFTSGNPAPEGRVTPVDSSTTASLGVTYALHNDDDQDGARLNENETAVDPRTGSDIALAAISQSARFEIFDRSIGGIDPLNDPDPKRRLANTIGFALSSSPLMTAADANGARTLLFVAHRRQETSVDPAASPCLPGVDFEDQPDGQLRGCLIRPAARLFKVVITDAGGDNASASADLLAVNVPNPNPLASPTLVDLAGTPHVAVSGTDGAVRTYTISGLDPGPAITGLGAEVYTPSIPTPAAGQPSVSATVMYVGSNEPRQSGAQPVSKVHKITIGVGGALSLGASSPVLPGQASPGLAVTQRTEAGGLTGGRIIYSTANNLYSLDVNDLTRGASLHIGGSLTAGTSGFSRTTAAASGGYVYVSRDNGEQLMLQERTLDSVPADSTGFTPIASNPFATNVGGGQPAISQGYVAFSSTTGATVYRNQTAPSVRIIEPAAGPTDTPRVTLKATAFNTRSGVTSLTFTLDGVVVGTDTTPDRGNAFSAEDPAVFSVSVDLSKHGSGRFTLGAQATDGDLGIDAPAEVGASEPRTIIWLRGR